jgi:hypothetical protein
MLGPGRFNSLFDSCQTLPWNPGCLEQRTISQAASKTALTPAAAVFEQSIDTLRILYEPAVEAVELATRAVKGPEP